MFAELRKLLPAAENFHFLNYAATSPMLKPSADQMKAVIEQGLEPLSTHFDESLALLEASRRIIADLIHASPEEIAFTTNTSSALSLIAGSIVWKKGDRVLYSSHDFPSNRFVWDNLSRFGVLAEGIAAPNFLDAVMQMDLNNVKLISISAVSYMDGRQQDIPKLAKYCRSKGILVAVDAIQAVGAIPVNVRKWECDFLACGGQKWLLGPIGSGFLYINAKILPESSCPHGRLGKLKRCR